ncbi:Polynucleotide adenylyltransferase, partial [Handroanthus impetiginosus]
MGELGVANSDRGPLQRSGFVLGCKSSTPPDPPLLCQDCLPAAEEAAQQVLNSVHPTLDSEEKRRDIIDYVQRLIKSHLNCEVFPYGSVPLKTYLPDGDIDFTVLKSPNAEESLAHDVFALLKREEKNENAEFQVKDTQFIDAEVKLVKCLVGNIVIDISFNQLGGFSTLCFLEQVDRLVGRNHLFKRSIILVKAWCYYESRVLGAHHGLMSTYALETLVLYIFHLFHSSLSGPLEVLYRFLEYYGQFDWDNYCISLKGPVYKSTLPNIVVRLPESGWNDLLLSEEFLGNCIEMFSVSSRTLGRTPKEFQPKHFNIIDPLKENNNLGRSVHRGNFYRIRSAFKYGARRLGQILSGPRDKVADKISDFFASTLERH